MDTVRNAARFSKSSNRCRLKSGRARTCAQPERWNQQKVVIGKWLLTDAQIYLLHDPTRGMMSARSRKSTN